MTNQTWIIDVSEVLHLNARIGCLLAYISRCSDFEISSSTLIFFFF